MPHNSPLEKLLPPTPMMGNIYPQIDIISLLYSGASALKSETPYTLPLEYGILKAKTLRRKNFKQLSLTPFSVPESDPPPHKTLLNTDKQDQLEESWLVDETVVSRLADLTLSSQSGLIPASDSVLQMPEKRKRQTIISSILPTRLSMQTPSPQGLNNAPILSHAQGISPSGTTASPIATTTAMTLDNTDLVTLKALGAGTSGTVMKILHVPTKRIMAKKIIPIDLKTVIKTQIIRELRILHECHSPFIIDFYGAFVSSNNTIVICTEYCNCGLLDKISSLGMETRQFPIFALKRLSFAILLGLTYLYNTHKIIHRDIKPLNVLMTHRGEFKLCDFGVSRELTNSLAVANTFVGTSTYMLPERIQGLEYGIKSDVWLMGLMLIELASGKPVWQDDVDDSATPGSLAHNGGPEGILDLLQRIVNETPPTLSQKINPKTHMPYDPLFCDFINSCLVKKEAHRKLPMELLSQSRGFLSDVHDPKYESRHKGWTKGIRKLQKEQ